MRKDRRVIGANVAILVLTLGGWQQSGAGDVKTIKSRDGSCQVSVPGDWSVGELGGMADSPDKKSGVAVSSPKMVDSFAQLKENARTVYKNSKVIKDSASEFEMEGQSITGQPDVYRAIPIAAGKFCITEVTYKTGNPDQARKIAASLAAGR